MYTEAHRKPPVRHASLIDVANVISIYDHFDYKKLPQPDQRRVLCSESQILTLEYLSSCVLIPDPILVSDVHSRTPLVPPNCRSHPNRRSQARKRGNTEATIAIS